MGHYDNCRDEPSPKNMEEILERQQRDHTDPLSPVRDPDELVFPAPEPRVIGRILAPSDGGEVLAWFGEEAGKKSIGFDRSPTTPEPLIRHSVLIALQASAQSLEEEVKRLRRESTDRAYMLEAYGSMLGPTALKVVEMWAEKHVKRVHHSWGPEAASLTGEERAQILLEWEAAMETAVEIRDIDGHLPTTSYQEPSNG